MTETTTLTHYCKVCKEPIHPKRAKMGYTKTCVQHSTAERYTGIVIADAKATNSLQIVRDAEVGKHLVRLEKTRGRVS